MSAHNDCILAIAPVSRGFGVFVLGSSGKPLEWKVAEVREKKDQKNARCLAEVDKLIEHYRPSVLVLEDPEAQGSKKRERVTELIGLLSEHAIDSGIGVAHYGPRAVRLALGLSPTVNKVRLAQELAQRFEALRTRVPPHKRIWEPDAYAIPIFVAAGLAVTHHTRQAQLEGKGIMAI